MELGNFIVPSAAAVELWQAWKGATRQGERMCETGNRKGHKPICPSVFRCSGHQVKAVTSMGSTYEAGGHVGQEIASTS
jgi:hypothetical protein